MRSFVTKQPSNQNDTRYKSVRQPPEKIARSVSKIATSSTTLQRQSICTCGGGCPRCQEAALLQTNLKISVPEDKYEQEADYIADQVVGMPEPSIQQVNYKTETEIPQQSMKKAQEHQEALQTKPLTEQITPLLQRQTEPMEEEEEEKTLQTKTSSDQIPIVSSNVQNSILALKGDGQPLPQSERAFFEPRFGADFSQVRIHTDPQAGKTANRVNARAFTLGKDIIFGTGQYQPYSSEGKHLLAHELTHVVQQTHGVPIGLQCEETRRPRPAPVDANAQRIIDLAQDTTRPMNERAVAVVQAIINQYFARDRNKISQIIYRADEPGLHTTYTGRGTSITGIIEVGRYFVEHTTQRHFARRVLQVRHEIEHVEQQRAGMTGRSRQDEREFIAFYHEALATELPGTGRLQHSTRVGLIDAALGYYYCLSADLQHANTTRRDELLTRRAESVRRSGRRDLGAAPTSCRRP